jgi:hypothetical protein
MSLLLGLVADSIYIIQIFNMQYLFAQKFNLGLRLV